MKDLSKLCIHTITTKPLRFSQACSAYAEKGVKGITIWRDAIRDIPHAKVKKMLSDHGLDLVSYCRGGFFPHPDKSRRGEAIEDNKKMIDEAKAIEAPMIVLVCGAHPDQSLEVSRNQIREGIEAILPFAEKTGIKLAIEPLHPMYTDDRSAINTMAQANTLAEEIDSLYLGIAVDVYHVWWDPDLKEEIMRCGEQENLFAFHICDWLTPTKHLLLDRGLMGEGCINIRQIRGWVEEAGFEGYHEVEIFSERWWEKDQEEFLNRIIEAYDKNC